MAGETTIDTFLFIGKILLIALIFVEVISMIVLCFHSKKIKKEFADIEGAVLGAKKGFLLKDLLINSLLVPLIVRWRYNPK